jgi:quinol monooxygenase YgiN
MIFIVVKFHTKPDWTQRFPEFVRDFTEGTRAEEGNLFFEWYRSLDEPDTYVLVEGFADADAGAVHCSTAHFHAAVAQIPQALSRTPEIISQAIEATGWSEMAEMKVVAAV